MKTHLRGPMDYARKLKLRFRVGDLDLPKEQRDIPVCGRRTWTDICARAAQHQSRTHTVGKCEIWKINGMCLKTR